TLCRYQLPVARYWVNYSKRQWGCGKWVLYNWNTDFSASPLTLKIFYFSVVSPLPCILYNTEYKQRTSTPLRSFLL
ncbi:MAG TPA: hypothetical protein PK239_17355, partial [Chitinophagales bacterium]|nr:hypothetical protein [Chitinophagales bacterium]